MASSEHKPVLIVIAGPNGSDKTSNFHDVIPMNLKLCFFTI